MRRKANGYREKRWDEFWVFVQDVGEPPSENHRLKRINVTEPWGLLNFYWKERLNLPAETLNRNSAYSKAWRAKNPVATKGHYLKKSHGITLSEYDSMLGEQDGKCAICGGKDKNFRLAVDHCHETGRIRGLLCSACNKALGGFKDSIAMLQKAVAYLERHGGGN